MTTDFCKNCDSVLTGKYCHNCGQKHYTDADKNIKGMIDESVHFLTHFEGSFLTSVKAVLLRPGKLSADYCNGIRKKYYKPISLFLLLIVFYLLFPLADGMNMELKYYKAGMFFGPVATEQIADKMAELDMTEPQLSQLFHEKSEKVSKVMMLILVPLTAGALWLLYFNRRRKAFDLLILATEFNVFILMFVFMIAAALFGLLHLALPMPDELLLLMIVPVLLVFTFIAFRRFFGEGFWMTGGKAVAFLFLYAIVTQAVYKFLLFETVMLFL